MSCALSMDASSESKERGACVLECGCAPTPSLVSLSLSFTPSSEVPPGHDVPGKARKLSYYFRRGLVVRGAFVHSGHVVGRRRNRNADALRPAVGGGSSASSRLAAATRSTRSRLIIVGSSEARYASIAVSVAFDLRSSYTILSGVSRLVCQV